MSIIVNQAELLAQVEAVAAGLTTRDAVVQSSCIVFRRGYAITFSGEVLCKAKTCLPKDFTAVVPGQRFVELVRKLAGDSDLEKGNEAEAKISLDDTHLTVGSGKMKGARLRYWKEVGLQYREVPVPEEWKPLPDDFCQALETVEACAGTDKNEFLVTVVHLTSRWVEAMNNFQMCRHKAKTGLSQNTLIRRFHAKAVAKLEVTEFAETPGWLHFRAGSRARITVAAFYDQYKDLTPSVNVKGAPTSLPKGLVKAADWGETFAAEYDDKAKLTIQLGVEPKKMKVIGEGISGEAFTTFRVEYDGEPMEFRAAPKLVRQIGEKYDHCEIATVQLPSGKPLRKLKVDGGRWTFVTVLAEPQSTNGKVQHDSEAVGEAGEESSGEERIREVAEE